MPDSDPRLALDRYGNAAQGLEAMKRIRVMTKKQAHARVDLLLSKAEYFQTLFLNTLAEIEEVVPHDHPLRNEIQKLRQALL